MKSSFLWNMIPLLFLLLVFHPGIAQQQDSIAVEELSIYKTFENDSRIAVRGIKTVYLSPLHWHKYDLLTAGSLALGTGLLYSVDKETSEFFTNQKNDIPKIFRDLGSYGSPETLLALNGAVYLSGLLLKNEKVRHTGLLLVTSATASGLLLSVSKVIVGRARPVTGEGKGEFGPFNFGDDRFKSFPSGHALFAFSTAYAIGKKFKNPFLKAGIYSLGLIGPASRVWEGEHWLTDVTVSMALGVAVVETVDRYLKNEKKEFSYPQKKISWSLNLGPTAVGITGTF